jgi:hypothetical protein
MVPARPVRSYRLPTSDRQQALAALVPVYAARRERTYRLVMQAVDALRQARARVSIATIVACSRELNADGKGVSKDAILDNVDARAYYEAHRTAQTGARRSPRRPKPQPIDEQSGMVPILVSADRDLVRVRQRYDRLTKRELVARLVDAEQALAAELERWLGANDLIFWWMHAFAWAAREVAGEYASVAHGPAEP